MVWSVGGRLDWFVVKPREEAEVWDLNWVGALVLRRGVVETVSVWVGKGLGGAVALRLMEIKFIWK